MSEEKMSLLYIRREQVRGENVRENVQGVYVRGKNIRGGICWEGNVLQTIEVFKYAMGFNKGDIISTEN